MKFQSMRLPFLRAPDYYAETAKSDAHMGKVKGRLLVGKREIEEEEERRKSRESKKIAKEVIIRISAYKKTDSILNPNKEEKESVKKWRKQKQQSGFAGGDKDGEIGLTFEDGKSFERLNRKRPRVSPWKASQGGGKGKKGVEVFEVWVRRKKRFEEAEYS